MKEFPFGHGRMAFSQETLALEPCLPETMELRTKLHCLDQDGLADGGLGVGSNAVVELRWVGTAVGTWTNGLTVTGAELDPATATNTVEWVATTVPSADLSLTAAGTTDLVATDAATETIVVTNAGPGPATAVIVTGQSGGAVEVVGWTEGAVVETNDLGGWQWTVGTLAPGENATLSLAVVATRAGPTTTSSRSPQRSSIRFPTTARPRSFTRSGVGAGVGVPGDLRFPCSSGGLRLTWCR